MAVEMNMPILVVDDYKTMVRIIRNLLKQIGFENVDEASDGAEAFEMMKKRKYGKAQIRAGDLRLEYGAGDRLRAA